MHAAKCALAFLLLAIAGAAPGPSSNEINVPAGTDLHIRLKAAVSSNTSKAKDPIEAVVVSPVVVDGAVAVPAGTVLRGQIADVRSSTKPDERALLSFGFQELLSPAGTKIQLNARIVDVDNARESVDDSGRIVGILASETLAARIDQGIGKVARRNAGLAEMLEMAKSAVLKQQPTGEIRYEPGVELQLRTLEPLKLAPSASGLELEPVPDESTLYQTVNAQPFRTVAENPPKPSDITNLMFAGTEEELRMAFKAAGWSLAQEKNAVSVLETVAAIAEMRGFKEAPMSKLLLEGKRSDLDFQKGNNTFAKRHHLRIWRRPDTWKGKPIWVCAATHDIAIDFSEENRTFIHRIDPYVDRERAKVVSDVLLTKQVRSLALVERPEVPAQSFNATGDEIRTDGRIAVLILSSGLQ